MKSLRNFMNVQGIIDYQIHTLNQKLIFDSDLLNFLKIVKDNVSFKDHSSATSQKNNSLIGKTAERFHSLTNTNTLGVKHAFSRLNAGAKILRIFHQPNTLTALNIAGLLDLADYACDVIEKSGELRPVVVFILLDYDDAGDQRFRIPILPASSGTKFIRLKGAVPRNLRKRVACSTPPPSTSQVNNWMRIIKECSVTWARLLGRAGFPASSPTEATIIADEVAETYAKIYRNFPSITLTNSAALSWLANVMWRLDTLFIPSSWLLQYSHSDMIGLLKNEDSWDDKANKYIDEIIFNLNISRQMKIIDIRSRGAWRICPLCFRRNPTRVFRTSDSTVGEWLCKSCNSGRTEALDRYETIFTQAGEVPRLIPTVNTCDLLEILTYRLTIGFNYAGSVEHIFWSRIAAAVLNLPSAFEYFWDPSNLIDTSYVRSALENSKMTSSGDEEKIFIQAFQKGRFPAVFFLAILGRERLRKLVLSQTLQTQTSEE